MALNVKVRMLKKRFFIKLKNDVSYINTQLTSIILLKNKLYIIIQSYFPSNFTTIALEKTPLESSGIIEFHPSLD